MIDDLPTMLVACPVCGCENITKSYSYSNIFWPDIGAFNKLEIISCNSCGFGFSWPELTDAEVEHFYINNYRAEFSPFYVNFESLTEPVNTDVRALSQVLLAKQFVSFGDGDCFVDIGPGGGGSFSASLLVLPSPVCCAIELNAGAATAFMELYGIQTYTTVTSFIASGKRAKICLLSHSLEHYKLSWLAGALEELKGLLSEDGVLVIEVPLVDMRRHAELRGEDAPHFLFFTIDSIKILFEKYGWTVLFCNSVGETYETWQESRNSASATQQSKQPFNRIVKDILRSGYSFLPKPLKNLVRCITKNILAEFSGPQFSYGGDRTCLRLVVTPCFGASSRKRTLPNVSSLENSVIP